MHEVVLCERNNNVPFSLVGLRLYAMVNGNTHRASNKKRGWQIISAPPFINTWKWNVNESVLQHLHFVALPTVVLDREGILALVMTGAAGFAGFHVAHGGLQGASFKGEYLGVAL